MYYTFQCASFAVPPGGARGRLGRAAAAGRPPVRSLPGSYERV